MFKLIACLILYTAALVFIYAGVELNNGADWPRTDAEIVAALMIIIGMTCKLLGHVTLFSTAKAN